MTKKESKQSVRKPPKAQKPELQALQALVEAKAALWAAWDSFEKVIGKNVCPRTEADADRALSNMVIAGAKNLTMADVKFLQRAIAWEGPGPLKPAVVALTDVAVVAVRTAIKAALGIAGEGRRRSLDLEGSTDGECRVGVLAEMPLVPDDDDAIEEI